MASCTGVSAAAPLGPVCWGLGLYGSDSVLVVACSGVVCIFGCMSHTQGSPSLGAKT